jgi:hypothetical protein
MFPVEELMSRYEAYSDKELYDVHKNIEGYSEEAREALEKVIKKRGGLEALVARLKAQQAMEEEKARIISTVGAMSRIGRVDVSSMKRTIGSKILSPQQVSEIIDGAYQQTVLEMEDRKIKPRTVIGGIIGTVIAAVIGGGLWGLRLIYGPPAEKMEIRIHYILLFGLVLVCYGTIKLCTKQSWKNAVVLIGSVLSVVLALVIGEMLYDMIGAR